MEGAIAHFAVQLLAGCLQHLHRHDESILEQIIVHHAMAYDHGAVVGGRGKDGIPSMKFNATNWLLMVAQCLVRLGGQVQIEPLHPRIDAANNDVVT